MKNNFEIIIHMGNSKNFLALSLETGEKEC